MAFLEAAHEILKQAGQPLHHREITRRALNQGLIETSGKTPDATMRAQIGIIAALRRDPAAARPVLDRSDDLIGLADSYIK